MSKHKVEITGFETVRYKGFAKEKPSASALGSSLGE